MKPISTPRASLAPARACFAKTLGLLLLGLAPVPAHWAGARAVVATLGSPELNRSDREADAGGYYEGLIGGGDGPQGARGELAMALLGKPTDWARFHAADVTQPLPDGDFLQFELKPNVRRTLFGQPFTTNRHGMRDRDYDVEKPPGTYRVAVLGSSMDMGWGVSTEATYVNRLEDWLNAHAAKHGVSRRFEVLNFAVAAYAPLQRLEAYRRKARAFRPDLVVYSATTLDNRLAEIHLCDLFRGHADLSYDFLKNIVAQAGVTPDDLTTDGQSRLLHKERVKARLQPCYDRLYDETLAALAADCRSDGVRLVAIVIPRVGKADAPEARAAAVARLAAMAAHHALPFYDLSGTFDGRDPALFEIAAWDDHPNALGHRRLFFNLSRALVQDQALYHDMFFPDAPPRRGGL